MTHLGVDYHPEPVVTPADDEGEKPKASVVLSAKEIGALARMGDIRATLKGVVNQIPVAVGDEVAVGDTLVVLEAMKAHQYHGGCGRQGFGNLCLPRRVRGNRRSVDDDGTLVNRNVFLKHVHDDVFEYNPGGAWTVWRQSCPGRTPPG